ncbi:hypothetical protein ABKV19_007987 [Rosa sericea]
MAPAEAKLVEAVSSHRSSMASGRYEEEALEIQKKHLMLAEEADDLVEQQRANTQLGRTYHEMFRKSLGKHQSMQNAKKYFMSAMKLARTIKDNPPTNKSSFIKEYIDAYSNIGLLELDLDNLEEAEKIFATALDICNEEEVNEYDEARARLHHNLGKVYTELGIWDNARQHIDRDIMICKQIGHCKGEANGYISLGQLLNRAQKYQEALLCYQKALDLAKSMEDEDALVHQIDGSIKTVKKLAEEMDDMKREEQNLYKLTRDVAIARGTSHEQLQQIASLGCPIDRSKTISARSKTGFGWLKWPYRSNDDSPATPKPAKYLRLFRKSTKKVNDGSLKAIDGDDEERQLLGNLLADDVEEQSDDKFFTPESTPPSGDAPAYDDSVRVVVASHVSQEIVGWIWLVFHIIVECILGFVEIYGIGNPRWMLAGAVSSAVAAYFWIAEIVGMHRGPFRFWRLPFVPEIFGLVVVFVQFTYFVMGYVSLRHDSEETVRGPIIRICVYSLSFQICLFLQRLGRRFG